MEDSEKLSNNLYILIRYICFAIATYLIVTCICRDLEEIQKYKIILLITIIYVFIDTYYPSVKIKY